MQGKENIVVLERVSGLRSLIDRILFLLATLDADLVLLGIMTAVLMLATSSMGGHIRWIQASVGLPIAIMLAVFAARFLVKRNESFSSIPQILRDWLPFLIISFIYENLHDVAEKAMSGDIAAYLYKLDISLFGVEPTLWTQKFFSPILTDLMSISYAMYFFLPLFIMFLLSMQDRRPELRHMAMCITFVFLMGFFCYVFLPASPPRYFMTGLYTSPAKLYGLFLYDRLQAAWDGLSVISGGAFPSLHVGISSVALIYAFKFRKISTFYRYLWWIYIPLVVNLWISTVYLRHHWFIDIVAGWAVAGLGFIFAILSLKLWGRLRDHYGINSLS